MASPAGRRVNAVTLIVTVVAGATVFARLFTRFVLVRKYGFEDGCITFAMVLSVALAISIAQQARDGMGMHIFDLSESQMISSQKAFWASVWMYNLSLTATKISILVQYLRIFPTRRFRIACYIVLGIVGSYGVWTLFGNIFICSPVEYFWNKRIPGGTCLNQFTVWFTNGVVNILQDFVILALPMPVLRSLTIQKGQKRALMVLFALGGFVCIVSIIRLHSLVRISNSPDPTYDNPPAASFSAVETNLGIICACCPYMRPLLSAIFPAYFPETASRYVRPNDEERIKHIRTASASSRPYVHDKTSVTSHSRSSSQSSLQRTDSNTTHNTNWSEVDGMHKQYDMVTNTATYVKGHARKVTIGSSVGSERMLPFGPNVPKLPRFPEEAFAFGSLEQTGRPRHSGSIRSPRRSRQYRPQTPLERKPLPVTPFPVAHPVQK